MNPQVLGESAAVDRLCPQAVVEFARREVARTIGLHSGARFFLAGGAFKSLLTGREPRDLDIWAPSAGDRERVILALLGNGGHMLPATPFADVFAIAGRVVEVPTKTAPDTLAARLARFDLGLAAIGAEHRPGDQWTAIVAPKALESVRRQEVLLLDELPNWRHSLASLERMRRYAVELGFASPSREEARIWRIFEAQTEEVRDEMVLRFQQSARGGFGVSEEVAMRRL